MTDVILHKLQERVKELTALHRTARLLQDPDRPVADVMQELVSLLPDAWQYPDVAEARIRLPDRDYRTPRFRETAWMQSTEFVAGDAGRGAITVAYLEERPPADEGPFLAEERELIDSLGEMLRSHLRNLRAERARHEQRQRLEAEVGARTTDLRRLASRLTLAEARERRRIAGDLHDHIGQALAFMKLRLRELQGNAVFAGLEDSFDEILVLLDRTIRYTRDLTSDISPPVLYELGLAPALDWLAERFACKQHFRVAFRTGGTPLPVTEGLSVLLYTSAAELLFNAYKYSGEGGAELALLWEAGGVTLAVTDRGVGFDAAAARPAEADGFGLFSIRERLRDLGGTVDVQSAPGAGCRVTLQVPLAAGEAP